MRSSPPVSTNLITASMTYLGHLKRPRRILIVLSNTQNFFLVFLKNHFRISRSLPHGTARVHLPLPRVLLALMQRFFMGLNINPENHERFQPVFTSLLLVPTADWNDHDGAYLNMRVLDSCSAKSNLSWICATIAIFF
jgi:hypothetical protein